MEKLTFDAFEKKIYIKTLPDTLYHCWATEEGICSWFLRNARFTAADGTTRKPDEKIRAGDRYIWRWHNWDGKEEGRILQANGTDFLEFTFAGDCRVSVTLVPQDTAVLLSLKQYNIPTDDENKLHIHYGCSNGWTFWLANLKAYVEHGILLNETVIDLRNEPLAGFEYVNI